MERYILIPKIIWQTYEQKYSKIPSYLIDLTNTWKDNNPEYRYIYSSSEDRDTFVLDNFDKEWFDLFSNCPVPVMKADIWRLMVMYKIGGIYSDIDTTCNEPINNWIDLNKDLIVSVENEFNLATWTIAAAPNNPAILHVLENIKNKLKSVTDYSQEPYFVHLITGPAMFTASVLEYIGYPRQGNLMLELDSLNNYSKDNNLNIEFYSTKKFNGESVFHINASQFWIDKDDYHSWVKDIPYKMEWQE